MHFELCHSCSKRANYGFAYGDEFAPEPSVVSHGVVDGLAGHGCVAHVGELGGRVVAPDDAVAHFRDGEAQAPRYLGLEGG